MPSSKIPELYLYLTQAAWSETWVNGGQIPINPASFYRRDSDDGIFTTDEVLHRDKGHFPDWAAGDRGVIQVSDKRINLTVKGEGKIIHPDGREFNIRGEYRQWQDDAHILSFSIVASKALMERLGKNACIQLRHPLALKAAIDAELGVDGVAGLVEYTDATDRNHFLKGRSTQWQAEYRFVWNTGKRDRITVTIPPSSGTLIDLAQ